MPPGDASAPAVGRRRRMERAGLQHEAPRKQKMVPGQRKLVAHPHGARRGGRLCTPAIPRRLGVSKKKQEETLGKWKNPGTADLEVEREEGLPSGPGAAESLARRRRCHGEDLGTFTKLRPAVRVCREERRVLRWFLQLCS